MATEIRSALSTTDRGPGGTGEYDFTYTTLADWRVAVEARGKDLVTRDVVESLYCYPDWPSGLDSAFYSSTGWTTDATRFCQMIGVVSTDGILGNGFYLSSAQAQGVIRPYQEYFKLKNLCIESTQAVNGRCLRMDGYSNWEADSCILWGSNNQIINSMLGAKLYNCICYQQSDNTVLYTASDSSSNPFDIKNCTLIGGDQSFIIANLSASNGVMDNTVAYGYSNRSYSRKDTTSNLTGSNNSANDAGLPGDLGIIVVDGDFEDYIGEDFRLSSNSQLKDVGLDLPGVIDVDIAGTSRPQGPNWDVGAHEVLGVTPTTPKQNAIFHGHDF